MRLEHPGLVELLEEPWSPPAGFLFQLRQGVFDPDGFRRLILLLQSIEAPSSDVIPRRVVSLLWYLPSFVGWQRERIADAEGDLHAFDQAQAAIGKELERILGVP